jgi:hypothetical protein
MASKFLGWLLDLKQILSTTLLPYFAALFHVPSCTPSFKFRIFVLGGGGGDDDDDDHVDVFDFNTI